MGIPHGVGESGACSCTDTPGHAYRMGCILNAAYVDTCMRSFTHIPTTYSRVVMCTNTQTYMLIPYMHRNKPSPSTPSHHLIHPLTHPLTHPITHTHPHTPTRAVGAERSLQLSVQPSTQPPGAETQAQTEAQAEADGRDWQFLQIRRWRGGRGGRGGGGRGIPGHQRNRDVRPLPETEVCMSRHMCVCVYVFVCIFVCVCFCVFL